MDMTAKQKLYRLFLENFKHGEVSLQDISSCLKEQHISVKKYGYASLPDLLFDLPEFIEGRATKPTETVRFFSWNQHKNSRGPQQSTEQAEEARSWPPA